MKKLFVLLGLMILAATLVACNSETASEERGTIVMGTSAGFPPFEFIADHGQGRHGQYSGIDIAIGVRIAEALDKDLIIHDGDFHGLIPALQAETIDFIAAAMTIRPDRANNVHFSIGYFTAMQYIVVRANDDSINSAADLDGKIVGVQAETTGNFFVEENVDYGTLLPFTLITPAFMDLIAGGLDAIVIDSVVAMQYANRFSDQLRIVQDHGAFSSEHYGIAVRQDAQGIELLSTINAVLREMLDSGEMDALFGYYAGN